MTSQVAMLATISEDFLDGEYTWDDNSGIEGQFSLLLAHIFNFEIDNLLNMTFVSDYKHEILASFSEEQEEQHMVKDNRDVSIFNLSYCY